VNKKVTKMTKYAVKTCEGMNLIYRIKHILSCILTVLNILVASKSSGMDGNTAYSYTY